MKSKFLAILIILLSTTFLTGQKKHELKLDVISAIDAHYIPHYEIMLSKKIGVVVALGVDFRNFNLADFPFGNSNIETHEFSVFQLNPSIGGKYYFLFNKKYGNGLFIGPYVRINYLVSRGEGYAEQWEKSFNRQATERVLTDKGFKNLYYGIHGGYKWIIKSNLIIEIVIT